MIPLRKRALGSPLFCASTLVHALERLVALPALSSFDASSRSSASARQRHAQYHRQQGGQHTHSVIFSRPYERSHSILKIYNSLGRAKQEFVPLRPGEVRMYVCGMTVYDYCHLGHARVLVIFDVVHRWLRTSGYRVTYVRNITDIDDKIIRRARGERRAGRRAHRALHPRDGRGRRRARRREARPRAARHAVRAADGRDDRPAGEKNLAYQSASGDVNYAVRRFPGLRQALRQVARRAARRRARRRRRLEGGSARLRALEALQAGRADLEVAVGRRPAGLAHRVLGDEPRPARRAVRHPRRRPGPAVPAPRERDRAVGGRRTAARSSTTGCTTASSASTRRRCRSRSATSSPCARC